MRGCAKMRCGAEAVATVALRYEAREVVVTPLLPRRDPNLLELCGEHVDRLTPPIGWSRHDRRVAALAPS